MEVPLGSRRQGQSLEGEERDKSVGSRRREKRGEGLGKLMWGIGEKHDQWVVKDSGTVGSRNLVKKAKKQNI